MHYSGIIATLAALSGFAAALPRPPTVPLPKAIPIKYSPAHIARSLNPEAGVITRRALDSGAKVLKPIKVHPSFTKRSLDGDEDENEDSIDFSRLDLATQAQLIYGAPERK